MEAQIVIRSREIPFAKMLKTELCAAGFCAVLDGEKHAVPDILLLDVDTCRPQGIPKGCAVIAYSAQKRRIPKNCRFLLCRPFLLETLFAMVRQVQVDRVPESAGGRATDSVRTDPVCGRSLLSCGSDPCCADRTGVYGAFLFVPRKRCVCHAGADYGAVPTAGGQPL